MKLKRYYPAWLATAEAALRETWFLGFVIVGGVTFITAVSYTDLAPALIKALYGGLVAWTGAAVGWCLVTRHLARKISQQQEGHTDA